MGLRIRLNSRANPRGGHRGIRRLVPRTETEYIYEVRIALLVTAFPAVGSSKGNASTTGSSPISISGLTVSAGSGLYVQVAMLGTGLTTPTVTDSQNGVYNLLQSGHNGSVYLWVFRRSSPVSSSTAFSTTVTPSSGTVPIEIMAVEVLNDGGADAVSTFHSGTGTSETSSVATSVTNDLVLFFGADNSATFSSWGTGQTTIPNYPTAPTGLTAWGSYQSQASPGTVGSTRTVTASATWAAMSVSISPQVPWASIASAPYVTVSAIGLTTTPGAAIANNGADFGPDTPGTTTNGIQEAIASLPPTGGTVYVQEGSYSLSSSLYNTGNVTAQLTG
jgi:hypothetical protein